MIVSSLLLVLLYATMRSSSGHAQKDYKIVFDDSFGFGRHFEGIGGLSGGGATSKLLVNYPEKQRDQILDYLFKPNFGASLQILKVEIGGDAQSTDGTEASHMHNSWDENYHRGYEWWLMKEAQKRNPDIKLYGLPWGFPGWIGQGTESPYTNVSVTADYIVKWIHGAKVVHNLTIDYVGIWNERKYNVEYIKTLRTVLDKRGYKNTQIIASDGGWDIAEDIGKDPSLAKAVYGIGCHYPGTYTNQQSLNTELPLWSSEDFSTFNDQVGGGCWARILNQNYVNGYMTSTISWNLIASYYKTLPFYRDGLMTAVEPWSGNYIVETPIWISAHTTQFAFIGWQYLRHGAGVGKLPNGGSHVALVSPDRTQLTIVIETMTHDHSICIRPHLPKYNVEPQKINITLKGTFAKITKMNVWYSKLSFNSDKSIMFEKRKPIKFLNGKALLSLGLDEVVTLTTMITGQKGGYPEPPPSKAFPLPYTDNFEGYTVSEEPFNLCPQTGSLEVISSDNNKCVRQTLLSQPVTWCTADKINKSISVIGDSHWRDIFVQVDFHLSTVNGSTGAFVAARVDQGGCMAYLAHGIFFFVLPGKYILANDLAITRVLDQGKLSLKPGKWHKISLLVQNNKAVGAFDSEVLFNVNIPGVPKIGFAALGTDSYGIADFDNLHLTKASQGQDILDKYSKNKSLFFIKEHQ